MDSVESFKEDMKLVNQFSSTFLDTTRTTTQKARITLDNLEKSITEEQTNKSILLTISSSLSETQLLSLTKDTEHLNNQLSEKYTEYVSIIQDNTKHIVEIANSIRSKQAEIQKVLDTIKNIEDILNKQNNE